MAFLGNFFFFFENFCAVSFFLPSPFLSSLLVLRGRRKERDWLRGRARITRIPTILCWFTHSGVVESISETQNAWVTVDTGDTCIVLHWFPWICFTDVSRPWIGSRSVWRLGLTVLIDNPVKYVRTQPVWRTPRRRVCYSWRPGCISQPTITIHSSEPRTRCDSRSAAGHLSRHDPNRGPITRRDAAMVAVRSERTCGLRVCCPNQRENWVYWRSSLASGLVWNEPKFDQLKISWFGSTAIVRQCKRHGRLHSVTTSPRTSPGISH